MISSGQEVFRRGQQQEGVQDCLRQARPQGAVQNRVPGAARAARRGRLLHEGPLPGGRARAVQVLREAAAAGFPDPPSTEIYIGRGTERGCVMQAQMLRGISCDFTIIIHSWK